jgi:diguanylate cyclase (GGDEF)-like protein/PAS domain S-box-containing protein
LPPQQEAAMSKLPKTGSRKTSGETAPEVAGARPAIGEQWMRALARTAYSPMSHRRIKRHLDSHVAAMFAMLTADELDPEPALAIGEWLVAARYTGQRSLQHTVDVLGPALRTLPELASVDDLPDRVVHVLGALAAGYANAVRRQIFEEQEKVRNALLLTLEETQQELHDSEARFRQVFASSAVGIVILDPAGNVVEVNPALLEMLGHTEGAPDDVFTPHDLSELRASCDKMLADLEESTRSERRFSGPEDDEIWANVVLSVVRDSDEHPKYFVAVMEDITDQRRLREYLRYQALHDVLTGLPNWQSFLPHLENVLGKLSIPRTITLCYLDVDSVGIVNDGLGYSAGDKVLATVANRLQAVVADETATVARVGGDEFIVLIEDSPTTPSISDLADAIDRALSAPIPIGSEQMAVSAGMGFVRTSATNADALTLLRRAHSTLRRAEDKGKRQWANYDPEHDAADRSRLSLIATMPGALARGDIFVEYLPVRGEHAALAARLRWELPDNTVLHHVDCLRYADELGHSGPLSEALLIDACSRAAAEGVPVLVRLSPDMSRDPDLTARVGSTLTETGLSPGQLWLSLNVRGLSCDEGEDNLAVLADMGVRTVVHDVFGSMLELSIVERCRPHAVELAALPDGELARAAMSSLVPLLRSTGALVVVDEAAASQWFQDIGVDLVVPVQPGVHEY